MVRHVLVGALVIAVLAASATAADHPQDALKLILKQDTVLGKVKAVWVSKNPAPLLPAQPPTSAGGVFVVSGVDESASVPLPRDNWQTNSAGTSYKFVNKLAPAGGSPVKVSVLKGGKVLKVVAKDSIISLDDTAQGSVAVALTIGTDTYCSVCATPIKDIEGVYIAKGCGAPLTCPMEVRPCGEVDGVCGGACPENLRCFAIGVGCHGEPEPCRCHGSTTTCPTTSTTSTTLP